MVQSVVQSVVQGVVQVVVRGTQCHVVYTMVQDMVLLHGAYEISRVLTSWSSSRAMVLRDICSSWSSCNHIMSLIKVHVDATDNGRWDK